MTDVEDLLREAMHAQDPHLTMPPDAAARALRARSHRHRRIGGAALSLAVVAGIAGGLVVATRPSRPQTATNEPAQVVSGSAHDQAVAETQRLLRLAPVPASATPLANAPTALSGPALGTPVTSALVISTRFVRVPLSVAAAQVYLSTHKPAGLTYGGNSTGTGLDGSFAGIAYRAPDSAAWTNAQLQISVAALDADTSAWRIDGLAIVVDQKPLPDTAAGPRVHVTVAQGCPASDRGVVGVHNNAAGLNTALLPSATPTAALVCWYDGSADQSFGLSGHTTVGPAAAQRLAAEARASTLSHPAGASVVNCPAYQSVTVILAFHYTDRSDVDLYLPPSGCAQITNGVIAGQPSSSLLQDVASFSGRP